MQTLHVGDRFTLSGNDTATRDVCRCVCCLVPCIKAAATCIRGYQRSPLPLPSCDLPSVLWVANPEETGFFIKMLLKDIRKSRWQPYIE